MSTVLYKDATGRNFCIDEPIEPTRGCEFIELGWDRVPDGFELCISRGIFLERYRTKTESTKFATISALGYAFEKHLKSALNKGFREEVGMRKKANRPANSSSPWAAPQSQREQWGRAG